MLNTVENKDITKEKGPQARDAAPGRDIQKEEIQPRKETDTQHSKQKQELYSEIHVGNRNLYGNLDLIIK